jgi:hypothetical protein
VASWEFKDDPIPAVRVEPDDDGPAKNRGHSHHPEQHQPSVCSTTSRAGCDFPQAAVPEGGIDPPNLPRVRSCLVAFPRVTRDVALRSTLTPHPVPDPAQVRTARCPMIRRCPAT